MIALLDTNEQQWGMAQAELVGMEIGQLLTPLTGFRNRGGVFAIDNGAFSGLDVKRFHALLRREWPNRARCIFVAVPDVVASARRTLEVFSHWYPKLHGWPLALVCQDGQEDLPILISAVFIGGSTSWKTSPAAEAICRAAKATGKHVHVGRVNGRERLEKVIEMGADSIDGSGISRYSHMRRKLTADSPKLFMERSCA
jgi:hypothetical protein